MGWTSHAYLSGTEVLTGKQPPCCATSAKPSAAGRSSTSGSLANFTYTQGSVKCSHTSCTVPKPMYMDKRNKICLLSIERFSHMQKTHCFCCFPLLYRHPEHISRSPRSWAILRLVQVVYKFCSLLQETYFDPQTTWTPRQGICLFRANQVSTTANTGLLAAVWPVWISCRGVSVLIIYWKMGDWLTFP